MNEEFNPAAMGGHGAPGAFKAKRTRPDRLPVEITHYNRAVINFLFVLVFFSNLLINVDHGSLPAATLNLKNDLELDNVGLGVLGSLVYLGLTVGKYKLLSY